MPIHAAEPHCFPANLLGDLAEGGLVAGNPDPADTTLDDSDRYHIRTWWVAHTKPRQEKSLARDLYKKEISYYLPQVQKTSIVRGRNQVSHIPVFPSYVFLYGNDFERQTSMMTNRIASFIRVNSPLELTRQLLDLSRLVAVGAPLTVESRLKAGDRVRVKCGALAGVEGTVVARRRKCRLIVAVSLIQQGVSIEIDDHLLEPI